MKSLFSDYNLCQLVDTPTQREGHTLDWVVMRNDSNVLNLSCVKEYPGLSDHFAVFTDLTLRQPPSVTRKVSSRGIGRICPEDFRRDLGSMVQGVVRSGDTESLVRTYDQGLEEILDRHAPVVSRGVRNRPSAPWMDDEVREGRRVRRRAERRWRKTKLTVHKEILIKENAAYRTLKDTKRREFYCNEMKSCQSSKQIFSLVNDLLGKQKSSPLPTNVPPQDLPQCFCDFFTDKIKCLRDGLDQRPSMPPSFDIYDGPFLSSFRLVSVKEVHDLIMKMPTKSCVLDPMPTTLTKKYLDVLIPLITDIVNSSLSTGTVPCQFKQAVVIPLLKKQGLDVNVLKNYRPVSNLPFISKVLERVVLKQLQEHLQNNNLLEEHQSAYRAGRGAETAVLSVTNSLLLQSDDHRVSALGLLDLSAAFDTLDHSILLQRLELTFGIKEHVLAWFTSYVSDRTQCVLIDGIRSLPAPLLFGVPQGSVLGPVLFTLYSQPLSDVMSLHDCQFHKYADDTELSASAAPDNFECATKSLVDCTHNVLQWMDSNKLKLNTDKTEVMAVGSPSGLAKVTVSSVTMGGSVIVFQDSVRYLGVQLDPTLSMRDQVSSICRACFLELRRIACIKKFLSRDAVIKLVSAAILSRLDYCNSTLAGITDEQFTRLQRVQNAAARLILGKRKHDHVTPLLKELHWLPVKARCNYKLAVLAYRHFDNTLAPSLSAALSTRTTTRNLRSSDENLLVVPRYNLKTAGYRSFSVAAPRVWNSLPSSLRHASSLAQFKTSLKTHFFNEFLG